MKVTDADLGVAFMMKIGHLVVLGRPKHRYHRHFLGTTIEEAPEFSPYVPVAPGRPKRGPLGQSSDK